MNGKRNLLFLGAGLAAGFVIAALLRPDDSGESAFTWGEPALDERLITLERRLASETAARLALSDEIDALRAELDALADRDAFGNLTAGGAPPAFPLGPRGPAEASAAGPVPEAGEARPRARRTPPTPDELEQRRIQRIVDAGFTQARAEWIERRVAQLQMEQLEAQYEAARTGDRTRVRSVDESLRAELGDDEYSRYLEATGRPSRIGVRNVLPSSPAEQVGLQPGDEIVAYGGKRVFDMNDLNRATLDGRPGETVVVEVLRDGQPLQLYVPRGPLGISSGARRR